MTPHTYTNEQQSFLKECMKYRTAKGLDYMAVMMLMGYRLPAKDDRDDTRGGY